MSINDKYEAILRHHSKAAIVEILKTDLKLLSLYNKWLFDFTNDTHFQETNEGILIINLLYKQLKK